MSLDALRKLHARTEETMTMELARITAQLVEIERQSVALDAQIQSDADAYCRHTAQGLGIEYALEWQARMDAQQAALNQTHQALETLTEAWNRTQARLVEAGQERKAFERLAGRREQAHRQQLERREQLISDEASYRRHRMPEPGAS